MPPTSLILEVYRGDELVRTERFTREIIKIGRLSSAHLCLDDERISRIHSVIEVGQDGASIIDMGSAEGTFVNGKRVSKGPLKQGDEIKLGGLRIVVAGDGLPGSVNRAVGLPAGTAGTPKLPQANGNGHAHAVGVDGQARAPGQPSRNGHAVSLQAPAAAVALRAVPPAAPAPARG
jgi:predicted component of type VI protein secretion system